MNYIEVYKQSQGFATELQVRKELGLMDRGGRIDGLQGNDYQVFDGEVDAIGEIEMYPVVEDRESYLRFGTKASVLEFGLKTDTKVSRRTDTTG